MSKTPETSISAVRIPIKKVKQSKLIIDPYSYKGEILHPPLQQEIEVKNESLINKTLKNEFLNRLKKRIDV